MGHLGDELGSLSSLPFGYFVIRLRFGGSGFLPGFGLFELCQFPVPLGGFLRLARGFAELHEALEGFLHIPFAGGGNFVLALLHALVAGEQQRLGFGVFLLPQQTGAQQAQGGECQPVIGDLLFAQGQALAGQGFGLGELSIGQQGADSLG